MTNARTITACLIVSIAGTASTGAFPRTPGLTPVPFQIVDVFGVPRPIVEARFNGHVMPMMIHSNATFFSQLKHAQAVAFGVRVTGDHRSFGIDRPGHVSSLGQDRGVAATLKVGNVQDRDASVSIFETPQERYGMLGIDWITRHRLILDYVHNKALVAPSMTEATALGTRLRHNGYVALPMTYDPAEKRYLLEATVNGVTRKMTLGTATGFEIDVAFAGVAHVAMGADDDGHGSGPTGTHVPRYRLAHPIRVRIGIWSSPPIADGRVMDDYGYTGEKRPADPNAADGGTLGGPFLVATGAVVDFGSRILYVRSPDRPT
jgi:hypothetical protein